MIESRLATIRPQNQLPNCVLREAKLAIAVSFMLPLRLSCDYLRPGRTERASFGESVGRDFLIANARLEIELNF